MKVWVVILVILGALFLLILIYGLIIEHNRRIRSLSKLLKTRISSELSIPIEENSLHSARKCRIAQKSLKKAAEIKKKIASADTEEKQKEYRVELANLKLITFYRVTLDPSKRIKYLSYLRSLIRKNNTTDNTNLRYSFMEQKHVAEIHDKISSEILCISTSVDKSRQDYFINKFEEIKKQDTSYFLGLGFSLNRMRNQINDLRDFNKELLKEYKHIGKLIKKVNDLLLYSRVQAFRNIYLGVELINLQRENSGGQNLTIVSDEVMVRDVEIKSMQEHKLDRTNGEELVVLNQMLSNGFKDFKSFYSHIYSDEFFKDFAIKNPKTAKWSAVALTIWNNIGSGISYLINKFEQRDELLEIKERRIEDSTKLFYEYQSVINQIISSLEIVSVLLKLNDEMFSNIYPGYRDKLFDKHEQISMSDLSALVSILNDYKEISARKI